MPHPTSTRGFALQARDRTVLRELGRYGCLTSNQIAGLVFGDVSAQVARRRLLKLTRARLTSRMSLPRGLVPLPPRLTGRPVYRLTPTGAALVEAASGARAPTFGTTLHDLLGNEALLRLAEDLGAEALTPEAEMRRQMLQARGRGQLPTGFVVPDGALHTPRGTIYLELVRTSVRRGNRSYTNKLATYLRLSRSGGFQSVFGHGRIRAVLTLTTSRVRAANLVRGAATLTRGRRLFWFGALDDDARLPSMWQSAAGDAATLDDILA